MLRTATLVLALSALSSAEVTAQGGTDEKALQIFGALVGTWVGEGTLMRQPAAFRMEWSGVDDGFWRLSFRNAFVGPDGSETPVLHSEATYLVTGGEIRGSWVDDRPQTISLEAVVTDSSLVTTWTAPQERGRTEYVVRGPDEVVVRDYVEVDGSPRLFGEAAYTREERE